MKKMILKGSLAMTLSLIFTAGVFAPSQAEAGFDLGGLTKVLKKEKSGDSGNKVKDIGEAVVKGVKNMNNLNAELSQLDGDSRGMMFEQIKQQYGVNYDYQANAQLDRIMARLTPVLLKHDPTVAEKPYNYFVNNDMSFNAFCTLGHNLSVNRGLFDYLNFHEDEIAFVLGHELAHGTHEHPAKGAKQSAQLGMFADIASAAAGGGTLVNLGSKIVSNLGQAKGITLPMEKQADADAFVYCSEAGYNVGAGAAVWQRILEMTSDKKKSFDVNQLFNPSDHPRHISRRDTYSKTLTTYSNNKVTVDAKTGMISVNKVAIGVPSAAYGQSALERTYLVAGNMADVYHRNGGAKVKAYISNGGVYLGDKSVMSIISGDDAQAWVDNLNKANGFK